MIYPYACDTCGCEQEIYKPSSLCEQVELCTVCNKPMRRVYTVPGLVMMTISNKDKEMCIKHKIDTGSELICIGDTKPVHKPKLSDYPDLHEISKEYTIDG